jgi:phage antirepressor YoqD-like protein
MNELKKFNYQGSEISFQTGNSNVMVNATEMAKPFSKRPAKWLELPSTQEFIKILSSIRKSDTSVIQTVMGSPENGGGTWMHRDAAIEFARWLSPAFAIWCNDRIMELMETGHTGIALPSRKELALMVVKAEEEIERLSLTVKTQAPKAQYYDEVLQSESLITTTVIAKDLGMTAQKLNKILHDNKIIYNSNGTWVLYEKHQNKGYTQTKTHTYIDDHGVERTQIHTYWKEPGRRAVITFVKTLSAPTKGKRLIKT